MLVKDTMLKVVQTILKKIHFKTVKEKNKVVKNLEPKAVKIPS